MRTRIVIPALLCCRGGTAAAQAPKPAAADPVDQKIRATCAADWPEDFSVQKFCVDQERAARKALDALEAEHRGDDTRVRIIAKCRREWPTSFTTAKFCAEQEMEALEALQAE